LNLRKKHVKKVSFASPVFKLIDIPVRMIPDLIPCLEEGQVASCESWISSFTLVLDSKLNRRKEEELRLAILLPQKMHIGGEDWMTSQAG
jgi:hypothetical protein